MNLSQILLCLILINCFVSLSLQLCLALADLALQMSSWQKPVVDLINRFGGSTVYLWPLLEMLTVLPEEVNSRSLRFLAYYLSFNVKERECDVMVQESFCFCISRLGANHRQHILLELKASADILTEFLVCVIIHYV